ncbi:periplasmic protein TonB [Pillotina sp. SPG140]|jgi:protein TonB
MNIIRHTSRLRIVILGAVAALHIGLMGFVVFSASDPIPEPEAVHNINLIDIQEIIPPAPPPPQAVPPAPEENIVESIAERMIETEHVPKDQRVTTDILVTPRPAPSEVIDYIPMQSASVLPKFSDKEILARLIYPTIAQRAGIEGLVMLELFVDRYGTVQRISILKEDPSGREFGAAAITAFAGLKASPARDKNGEPVAIRYRYPVRFKLR